MAPRPASGDVGQNQVRGIEVVEEPLETVWGHVRLRPDLVPVSIYGSDGTPLPVISVQVVEVTTPSNPLGDRFLLRLLTDTDDVLDSLSFETLDIMVDQAQAILGILPEEWEATTVGQGDPPPARLVDR
jgi:hypothetical protein